MADTPGYREGHERTSLTLKQIDLIADAREMEAQMNAAIYMLKQGCGPDGPGDGRALAIAQTKFDEAFMWLVRAIANPPRVLP